ncbi:MAG: hypothetical protein IJ688_10165 [Treponema sp.]|nr:hypothetical protein [Treponema sp.]
MKDIKLISGFAVFGFVLSFVSSLFSPHSSFIHKLLVALLFAVIFGIIGLGIKLIFDKFLNDSENEFGPDFSQGMQTSSPQPAVQKGQLVDITIQDEEISPGDSENRFVVGENHQMLNDSDIKSSMGVSAASAQKMPEPEKNQSSPVMSVPNVTQMASDVPEAKNGFTPMSAAALTKAPESVPVMREEAPASSTGNFNSVQLEESQEIDTLPDMSNFSFGSSESSASEEDDDSFDDDTGFDPVSSSGSAAVPEVKDAGLIAKAISSVLADEKSI